MLNIISAQRRATRIARKRIKECIYKGSTNLNLSNLNLKSDDLTELFSPNTIRDLAHLKSLNLSDNHLTTVPESVGDLATLESLNISRNRLTSLPESIGNLVALQKLYLTHNRLGSLPESIGNLTSLEKLRIANNRLESLPESIGNLVALQKLYLSENHLRFLPDSIGNLSTALTEFKISDNPLDITTQDFLQHTFGRRVEFNMAFHEKSVDWRITLRQLFGEEGEALVNKVSSLSDIVGTDDSDLPVIIDDRGRHLSPKVAMTQFLSKVRLFDPTNEYGELHCRVLRNLVSEALATRTNDLLPKLGQALGDCPTPVNNFVDTLIVEELAQGKGEVTPMGRAILERVAIMEHAMKKLSAELEGGDPQEKVQALTNSIFLKGYAGNPSNKVPIGGNRQWLPSLTRYVPFSARNVTKELGEAFARMVCKENQGELEKDTQGNYKLDMLKYAMITESYMESIGDYSKIGRYVEEFGQTLEKVIRDSELFLHAGEDNEVDMLLNIPERKNELRHTLLKLPPENNLKEVYEKESKSVLRAIIKKDSEYAVNSIQSIAGQPIKNGIDSILPENFSKMTVIQSPAVAKNQFKDGKILTREDNTTDSGISQSVLTENRSEIGRKQGNKHRRSLS